MVVAVVVVVDVVVVVVVDRYANRVRCIVVVVGCCPHVLGGRLGH